MKQSNEDVPKYHVNRLENSLSSTVAVDVYHYVHSERNEYRTTRNVKILQQNSLPSNFEMSGKV